VAFGINYSHNKQASTKAQIGHINAENVNITSKQNLDLASNINASNEVNLTSKDGNGTPLEPVNPANPEEGYKPPKITDPKENIKITYDKDDQKAKVKFVSVDPKTKTETELTDHALTLTGKSGETIPESDVQAHIDVLKSMGYDIVDNPFNQNPTFDTKKEIDQEFTIKVKPQVSTAKPVYVVEGDKPSSEKLKDAVTTKGNEKTVDEFDQKLVIIE